MTNGEPSWTSQPSRCGDIVTCWYPNDPKKRLRPVLVIETRHSEDGKEFSCRVAFGTSSLDHATRAKFDIILDDPADIANFGLAIATRFDLGDTALLEWTPKFFDCWRGYSTPIIGRISGEHYIDLGYKVSRLEFKD